MLCIKFNEITPVLHFIHGSAGHNASAPVLSVDLTLPNFLTLNISKVKAKVGRAGSKVTEGL